MSGLTERSREDEQMDALDLDNATYAALIADLAKVNTLTLSRRPTMAFLKRALEGRRHFRLLDVGFGQGDMLRSISTWAKAQGVTAELVGIDLNPRSEPIARAADPGGAIDYRTGDYADLAGGGFDFVVSSLVTHHMDDAQLVAFLRFMEAESRIGWLINDLRRAVFAHAAFPVLARVMRWHRIVREDGTLSIARSFREEDWRGLLAAAGSPPARIVRRFPFRLCVERTR